MTDGVDPPEPVNIQVPAGDVHFDPNNTGEVEITFNRSIYDEDSGSGSDNPRQQINEITAWIDASNVYGSDSERASELRTLDDTGRLKTSSGNLLPFNVNGLPNAGGDSDQLFLGGDVRANEQVGLTAMHTLFVREHNYQADRIRDKNPKLSGDEVYEMARKIVGVQMQVITYYEYLPALLGRNAVPRYRGYDPGVNANIANIFSSALFRYGHSALSPTLLRLDENGDEIEAGHLSLRNAFFAPYRLATEGGIEPMLRGLASQVSQQVDNHIIDDVRNFLFGAPGSGGFDLAALNIQRGRDPEVQKALAQAYANVDAIDLWVGGLAEDRVEDAMVGELIKAVLTDQFQALRDGDRYYFENQMSRQEADRIRRTKLSNIIKRNTTIGNEIQNNVFIVPRR